ncbi:MAG: hemerythrin domain-containing protein [Xanthomonadales bacterium]|nr:hemerythrin domain-containing protein [Xanthomonadales bacterium]
MLTMLRRWIGRDDDHTRSPPALISGSRSVLHAPSYDSSLVPLLKHDHEELLSLFQHIGQVYERRRYHELPALLIAFKTRLEAHLLTENVRFYNYVEASLFDDAENFALIRDFRREMNTIAKGVIEFVKKHQKPVNEFDARAFQSDYQTVGGLLQQRIQREESNLYPLYFPH